MFLLFEQAGGGQKFTGPPREKTASGSATPQNTSDFRVKKVGFLFYFAPHRKKRPVCLKPLYSGALVPGGHRSAPTEPAGETPGHSGKSHAYTHAKARGSPGKALLPAREGRDTPNRERPFAAPETPKNADRKKDSLALYGLPEAHKTRRIKKISLPRYPPTLRRPRETHRRPAWGSVSNSGGVIGQGEPLF